jgi:hypothetical protein
LVFFRRKTPLKNDILGTFFTPGNILKKIEKKGKKNEEENEKMQKE